MSIKTRTKVTHKNTFQKIQNKLIAVPSEVHVEGSGRPREETGTWDFTTFFWVFYCGLLPWISVIYLQKKVVSHASSCLSSKSCLCFKQQIYKMHTSENLTEYWASRNTFHTSPQHHSPAPESVTPPIRAAWKLEDTDPEMRVQEPTLCPPTFHGFSSTLLINGDTQLPQRDSLRTCPNEDIQNQAANHKASLQADSHLCTNNS